MSDGTGAGKTIAVVVAVVMVLAVLACTGIGFFLYSARANVVSLNTGPSSGANSGNRVRLDVKCVEANWSANSAEMSSSTDASSCRVVRRTTRFWAMGADGEQSSPTVSAPPSRAGLLGAEPVLLAWPASPGL